MSLVIYFLLSQWHINKRYLILEHGIVGDFKFRPGVCLHWHFALQNNAGAKPDITWDLKAIELNYTWDGLEPTKEARDLLTKIQKTKSQLQLGC